MIHTPATALIKISGYNKKKGPNTKPGIFTGIKKKLIGACGNKKIPANIAADTAPDAPRLL